MAKKILIVEDANVNSALTKYFGKPFKSYRAIAQILEIGQTALITVQEGSKDFWITIGFGEVTRETETTFSSPRRLMMEY